MTTHEPRRWTESVLPPEESGTSWELFHENSKMNRYGAFLSDEEVVRRMRLMPESLTYDSYPVFPLPEAAAPIDTPVDVAIRSRTSARRMAPAQVGLDRLATILRLASGVTRSNEGTVYPRPFRTTPSGGALYPIEMYVFAFHVTGLPEGVYHYHPARDVLHQLRAGDERERLAAALVQTNIAFDASFVLAFTAVMDRSIFKYGDRGYRFILLETGHMAQNVNLAAVGLGLGCVNLGGFFESHVDALLGIDGIGHSTLYLAAVARQLPDDAGVG
jgi:SagB-type dehydrogenase family enzyme